MGNRKLTDEQEQEVCERYKAGESGNEIASTFNACGGTIWSCLKRHSVSIKPQQESKRKYECNHDYFRVIDTEEKAYWLGFLAADGCISDTDGSLKLILALSTKDRDHIDKFRYAIESTHPIPNKFMGKKKHAYSEIKLRSNQLCGDLIKNGVTPRKTFTLRWPENISRDLLRHYLRGYFDGETTRRKPPSL